jgi:microcystin-dependent protein
MEEAYVGSVVLFAGKFIPVGWAFCDGRILSINEYQHLYAIIGNNYGGDYNKQNFALPDLRKQADNLGMLYIIRITMGTYPMKS